MKWIDDLGAELSSAASLDAATGLFVEAAFRELGVSATNLVPLFQGADPASETSFICDDMPPERARAEVMAAVATADTEIGPTAALFAKTPTIDLNEALGSRLLERTQLYNDFWRPRRVERELMGWMGTPEAPLGFLTLCRSIRDRPFRGSELAVLDQVRAHMERAFVRLADARQGWFGLDAVAHALRVGLPQPCGLFDELGRAIWLNEAAESEVGLRAMRTANGVLLPAHRPELTTWSDAVAAAARRSNDHEPYSFLGMSVRRIERPRLPSLFLVTVESSSAACLRQLSARERQIAELAARGYSVLNVAHQLGIAEGTTRNHLKRIYRKLSVCSRVDLARRVWGT